MDGSSARAFMTWLDECRTRSFSWRSTALPSTRLMMQEARHQGRWDASRSSARGRAWHERALDGVLTRRRGGRFDHQASQTTLLTIEPARRTRRRRTTTTTRTSTRRRLREGSPRQRVRASLGTVALVQARHGRRLASEAVERGGVDVPLEGKAEGERHGRAGGRGAPARDRMVASRARAWSPPRKKTCATLSNPAPRGGRAELGTGGRSSRAAVVAAGPK